VPAGVELSGNAAIVTMGWPEKRNALNPDNAVELADALQRAADLDTSAVILTGNGAFCAGGDLPAFAQLSATVGVEEIQKAVYGKVQAMMRALRACPVPTIAAVDGPAVGLGFDLALGCDMVFVGLSGWFRQGWARAGLIAGTGGIGLLARRCPSELWPLIASQEKITAARAVTLGLAEECVGDARAAALARADDLALIPREVLSYYVELTRTELWPGSEHFDRAAQIQASLIGSQGFRSRAQRLLSARG
jgi:enoyl-CoA hydratase